MNKLKTINLPVAVLVLIAGILFVVYALLAANALRVEYATEDMNDRVKEARKEVGQLRIDLSEVSSLDYVLERSDSLSYTEVQNVSYIERPSDSPFAAR
ncbi:MAG: hypothetical protein WDZ40_02575 [Candidatus Spechtbacterales bacterium]